MWDLSDLAPAAKANKANCQQLCIYAQDMLRIFELKGEPFGLLLPSTCLYQIVVIVILLVCALYLGISAMPTPPPSPPHASSTDTSVDLPPLDPALCCP